MLNEHRCYRDTIEGHIHIGGVYMTGGTILCGGMAENDDLVSVPHQEVTCELCLELIEAAASYQHRQTVSNGD